MLQKVFIDGKDGTTGLQIYDRLGSRGDIRLMTLPEEKRKDPEARRDMLNSADLVFLCLPDSAAIEAVNMIENANVKVIDASTAHRTAEGWAYGFPELSKEHRDAIAASRRTATPGCHASGFISTVYPLVKTGVIPKSCPLTAYSLTGYSGGGKKLIAEYEDPARDPRHQSHRIYGLDLNHKHLPEMTKVCGLDAAPVFSPILGDFYKGMATCVLLHSSLLSERFTARQVWERLSDYYKDAFYVSVAKFGGDEAVIYADTFEGTNKLRITVSGNDERIMLTANFDNLGKGASGAAVQNMNIMLGLPEQSGL